MVLKSKRVLNILVRKKPASLFLAISNESSDSYCHKLSIRAQCTYSHALGLLEKMREAGLLTIESRGKIKQVRLTVKGTGLSDKLKELMDCLSGKNIC